MSDKVTWWPASTAKTILVPTIVLLRHDWPDGQRIYEIGLYDPGRFSPWTDGHGGVLGAPDYFMVAEGQRITGFLNIPPEREYTYAPSRKAGKA